MGPQRRNSSMRRNLRLSKPEQGSMGEGMSSTLKCIEKWPTSCVIETPGRCLPLLLAMYAAATTCPWTETWEHHRNGREAVPTGRTGRQRQ